MNEIKIGGVYEHYKGGRYEIMGVAKHSETKEDLVVYKSLSQDKIWARPLGMFLEVVATGEGEKPRFKLVR